MVNDPLTSEKRYTCLQTVGPDLRGCGLVFGSWGALKEHEKTHAQLPSKENNEPLACDGACRYVDGKLVSDPCCSTHGVFSDVMDCGCVGGHEPDCRERLK
jgi:hypothetical protein